MSEANAVQEILDWLTSLVVVEVHPDCLVDDASLIDAVDILAGRAYKALGAGLTPTLVRQRMRDVLTAPVVLP